MPSLRTTTGTLGVLVFAVCVALALGREYRTADGSNNNLRRPNMGAKGQLQIRLLPAESADLYSPNIRSISNRICAESVPVNGMPNAQGMNVFSTIFGQFASHDRELTDRGVIFYNFPLLDGANDTFYRVNSSFNFINIRESVFQTVEAPNGDLQYELPNQATAWLDLDQLYGRTDAQVGAMRTGTGGRLKTSSYSVRMGPTTTILTNQLPSKASTGLPVQSNFNAAVTANNIMSAGDPRASENVILTVITTVYLREHNRLVDAFAAANPDWDDETLYQEARRINIAQYQHAIETEYLPAFLGEAHARLLGKYNGYKKNMEGGTSLEFSTAAFRIGHSEVTAAALFNASYCPISLRIPAGVFGPAAVTLTELPFAGQVGGPFTTPTAFALAGEGNIVRGFLNTPAQIVDTRISDLIRNSRPVGLTGPGLDLISSDMFRSRHHLLAKYGAMRNKYFPMPQQGGEADVYNLPACVAGNETDSIECFAGVTSNLTLADELRTFYGRVAEIDPIIGMLAEDHVAGSFLPRTAANIIADEFNRMRTADRFWYRAADVLTEEELASVVNRTFAAVFRDAYPGIEIQDDIFHVSVSPLPVC